MKRKQMMISFGAYDDDVYEFLQSNKNASALVRMLVREYMRGGNIPAPTPTTTQVVTPAPVKTEPVVVETEEVVESTPKIEFDYSKCKTQGNMTTNNENRKKIRNQLDL